MGYGRLLRLSCLYGIAALVTLSLALKSDAGFDHLKGTPPNPVPSTVRNVLAQHDHQPASAVSPSSDLGFAPVVTYDPVGLYTASVAVADVNGDAKPDLVVANSCATSTCTGGDGTVAVLLGNGDGTFQTAVTYDSGGFNAYAIALADVNGDGKLDIIVGNQGNSTVGVLLGNGDGTFKTAVTYGSGGSLVYSVAVADLNGDGKPDIVATNYDSGTVGVLLGNGDGTFKTAVTYPSGGVQTYSVAIADVNGDGKADLLVANQCADSSCAGSDGNIGVLLGSGNGTFQTAVTYPSGGNWAYSVAVADVNGDGKPDLVATNWCTSSSNCFEGVVGVLLGNGDGTFQTAVTYDPGALGAESVAIADLNGDGKPDLAVATYGSNNVDVLLGNGDGTFQSAIPYAAGGWQLNSVAIADVNGDGKRDLLVADECSESSCSSTGSVGVLMNTTGMGSVGLSTTTSNFGNEGVGKISAPQYVTLTNTGTVPLTINSIASTSTQYPETSTCPISPNVLSLSTSCIIAVRLKPSAVGTRTGSIIINDNAANSPQTINLTGNGVVSHITLSTTSLVFAAQVLETTSGSKKVKLTNTSTTTVLNITGISIAGDFTFGSSTNQCPTSGSVPPSSSCYLAVRFTPTAVGNRYGNITITDSDPASPNIVGLSGIGTVVKLSAKKLNFGSIAVGHSSLVKTITLSNVGTTVLSGVTIAAAGDFTQVNTCGSSVPAGGKCVINVTFTPTVTGTDTGIIVIQDSDPTSPQIVTLTGTGT